jgi:hypothetical protein
VYTVSTAIDLLIAVISGIRDIEVVEHLDLRDLPGLKLPGNQLDSNSTSDFTLYTGTDTRSIRVRGLWFACDLFGHCEPLAMQFFAVAEQSTHLPHLDVSEILLIGTVQVQCCVQSNLA